MSHLFSKCPSPPTRSSSASALPARWAHGINRAAELLRERHPKADDAEIMRMMLINGMVAVIDGANSGVMWEERNEDDQTIIAIAEAAL